MPLRGKKTDICAYPRLLSAPPCGCVQQMLAGELDAIIHSGASVNLVRSYQSLKPVNVLGTQVRFLGGAAAGLFFLPWGRGLGVMQR